jgi:hypothetical protein
LGTGGDGLAGPGGGGSPASNIYQCPWYACEATIPGHDGEPHGLIPQKQDGFSTSCTPKNPGDICTGYYEHDIWVEGPAIQPGCGWDIGCHFFVGFTNLFVNNQPSGALELGGSLTVGVGGDIGAPIVAEYGPEALSSGWSWIAGTGIPSVQYAARQLVTNPELLAAVGECASELLLPEGGPPPVTPVALACNRSRAGLGALGVGW